MKNKFYKKATENQNLLPSKKIQRKSVKKPCDLMNKSSFHFEINAANSIITSSNFISKTNSPKFKDVYLEVMPTPASTNTHSIDSTIVEY